jgi:mannosyltransferase
VAELRRVGVLSGGRSRTSARATVAVAVAAALGAVLGLAGITVRQLGFDEGATVAIVAQHGAALHRAIARDGGNMSGYYLVMHVLTGWFGNGPLALRLPSAVCAAATAGLVAAIGARLFDVRIGLLAGVLTAVDLPLVYWAQTARGYAPMLAFTCAGWLCFLSLADERAPRRSRAVAGYVLAMAVAAYCSFVAVLVIPVQLLAVARRPVARRRLIVAVAALALFCIPLLVLAARRGSGQLFWVPKPSHKVDSQVLQALTSTGLAPSFHPTFTTTAGIALAVAAIFAAGFVAVRARDRPTALVVAWAVIPVVLTFAYSLVAQPVFLPRNLLTCLPAVAIVIAVVVCRAPAGRPGVLGLLAVALAIRAVPLAAAYGVSPEPWGTVTHRVLAAARPGDCVTFYPEDARNPFRWYLDRAGAASRAPRAVLPAVPWSVTTPYVERYATAAAAHGCRRMWVVSGHEGQTDGSAVSLAHRAAYHRLDARLERAFGPAPIVTYGYASPIHVQLLPGRSR